MLEAERKVPSRRIRMFAARKSPLDRFSKHGIFSRVASHAFSCLASTFGVGSGTSRAVSDMSEKIADRIYDPSTPP